MQIAIQEYVSRSQRGWFRKGGKIKARQLSIRDEDSGLQVNSEWMPPDTSRAEIAMEGIALLRLLIDKVEAFNAACDKLTEQACDKATEIEPVKYLVVCGTSSEAAQRAKMIRDELSAKGHPNLLVHSGSIVKLDNFEIHFLSTHRLIQRTAGAEYQDIWMRESLRDNDTQSVMSRLGRGPAPKDTYVEESLTGWFGTSQGSLMSMVEEDAL